MIIQVSIVDKHKSHGENHVGLYTFEIDRPNDSHFDIVTFPVPVETEHLARPLCGRLLSKEEIENPISLADLMTSGKVESCKQWTCKE